MATSHSPSGIDLSDYALETIRDDGAFVLCRGYRTATSRHPASILVVTHKAEHPRLESLEMLEHEFALRFDLDSTWAVRPIALVHHQGRTCLVLDDSGGELLARRLGTQPMELGLFLRLGVGLAAALGALHRRGFTHKDLTPDHVMIDEATGRVWLTGFRIASRVRRQRQTPEPPEVIAGTLPYMAPEQTGRMNRSIDSRSDLYALGVTLYEMLTGTLPFSATDPMGWVHCHIARQPIPPAERLEDIPPPVSAIIMRLLAKTAEERYQTAAGVERDLRRCLTQWETERRNDDFPLGEQDTPDRLLIPDRLYGREREIETLLAAFDRVVTTGTPELLLVSGYSGIGKSSLVNELHKSLVRPGGLFASGKFDQGKRGIPYATLAQALQGLVRRLLVKSDADLAGWRATFNEALGPNGQLIVNLVPELELIIGEQPPAPDVPPQETQRRFQVVLERFLRVFARPEHPLALFVDDLQWLDTATLDFFEELLTHADVRHLLVIGAYRDNEVDIDHPLMRKLHAIRDAGTVVHEIALAPLTRQDVAQLVAGALHSEPERVAALAQLVCDKTAGNPFFTTQFLTALGDEDLLIFDHAHARWSWDLDRIRAKGYTDNVADLMFDRLARLPAHTQRALQSLACLGHSAEVTMLALVLGMSADDVHAEVSEAVRSELVECLGGSYRFLHDRVQEAAYALVPDSERSHEHLRIGRLLVAHTPLQRREETIFEIVNQLNRGATLITSSDEREQVSRLNLVAGKRARASAAYAAAQNYFVSGAALLPGNAWECCPELTFALEFGRGECEFLVGDLRSAEERLSRVAAFTTDLLDEAAVTCLRLALYTVLRRRDRAIEIGLSYLAKVGIALSAHPTHQEVVEEHERLWQALGERPIESLFDLPPMSDPRMHATIEVLTELQGPAHWTDQNLEHLLRLRTANLSIEHGNSDSSAVAYGYVGAVLGARFGEYAAGYRFGLLGLNLVDKKGLDRWKIRLYTNVGRFVVPWARHLREARPLLRRALEGAAAWRPLDYYLMWVYCTLLTHNFASGEPLADVQQEAEEARRSLTKRDAAGAVLDLMTGQRGLVRTLRGLTPVFGSFDDEEVDEHRLTRHLESDPDLARSACWYWIRKVQAYVYAAEYDRAAAMAARAQPFLWTTAASFLEADYHFHAALARAAVADAASPDERRGLLAQVAGHHQRLLQWTGTCPDNFESRAALVGAELARLDGRDLDAERLYESAIRSARVNSFVNIEALANELAGRFYSARGFATIATAYLKEARHCYRGWGADGKVRQLDQHYPHVCAEEREKDSRSAISEHIERLELETVLKALQAVSGEIVLERVIETLLRMAIEHAGADRGVLLLTSGAGLLMQAEATVDATGVNVQLGERPASAHDVAESVVQYVARAQETVILDDASTSDRFSRDVYIRRAHARSILCLPLMKQGRLVAVLYLENHLAPGVFTPARIAVLQVLAPQAAMSLENGRLYRELSRTEQALRRSQAYLTAAQRLSHTGSWAWEARDNRMTYWSEEQFRLHGFDPQEAPPSRTAVLERIHPDDRESTREFFETAIREKAAFDHQIRLLLPDGTLRYVRGVASPVLDTEGNLVEFVGTVMDLTEQKRALNALSEAQAQLAHVARVTTLGEVTASLAHEVNQPLAAVVNNATACLNVLPEGREMDELRAALEDIARDGTRAAAIVERVRALAKRSYPEKTRVHLAGVVGDVLKLIASESAARDVAIRAYVEPNLPSVLADRVQLQQVLLNLVVNGMDAMSAVTGGDRVLEIRACAEGRDGSTAAVISVSDRGIGLGPDEIGRVFQAFYTTKPDGMGMGLAISRSIIEAHDGRLWAERNPDRGATFAFRLPAAPGAAS